MRGALLLRERFINQKFDPGDRCVHYDWSREAPDTEKVNVVVVFYHIAVMAFGQEPKLD